MELSLAQWVALAVTSGLAAGVMNNLTSVFTGWLDRRSRDSERLQERTHAAMLRAATAHEAARQTFLPLALDLAEWTDALSYEQFQDEVGDPIFRPATAEQGLGSHAEVFDALRQIKYGHPTLEVREQAQRIFDELAASFSEFSNDGSSAKPVTLDLAIGWKNQAQGLVDLIHTRPVDGATAG